MAHLLIWMTKCKLTYLIWINLFTYFEWTNEPFIQRAYLLIRPFIQMAYSLIRMTKFKVTYLILLKLLTYLRIYLFTYLPI